MKIIFWLVFASALIYSSFFTEKDRLDREVKRLCAIDGGIKVYETVKLPAERFDRYGQISIPYKENVKTGDEYYYESSTIYLIRGNPELVKYRYEVYRQFDGKLLGEIINYSRRGGDTGTLACYCVSLPKETDADLNKKIFIKSLKNEENIMSQQIEYLKQAELALAAYADFTSDMLTQAELEDADFPLGPVNTI